MEGVRVNVNGRTTTRSQSASSTTKDVRMEIERHSSAIGDNGAWKVHFCRNKVQRDGDEKVTPVSLVE